MSDDIKVLQRRIEELEKQLSLKADKKNLEFYRPKSIRIRQADLDKDLTEQIDATQKINAIESILGTKANVSDLARYRQIALAIQEKDLNEALWSRIHSYRVSRTIEPEDSYEIDVKAVFGDKTNGRDVFVQVVAKDTVPNGPTFNQYINKPVGIAKSIRVVTITNPYPEKIEFDILIRY